VERLTAVNLPENQGTALAEENRSDPALKSGDPRQEQADTAEHAKHGRLVIAVYCHQGLSSFHQDRHLSSIMQTSQLKI
jgi:hypothetical protein